MSNRRYYCLNCETEVIGLMPSINGTMCHYCYARMIPIPDLEPYTDWEKRMGIPCPDNMPVWYKAESKEMSVQWTLTEMGSVRKILAAGFCKESEISVVIANGANKPGYGV